MTWPHCQLRRAPHRPLLPRCWELRNGLTIYDAAYVALAEAMKLARIFPAPLVQAQGLGWFARPLSSLDRGCA